jgi:cytochrome b
LFTPNRSRAVPNRSRTDPNRPRTDPEKIENIRVWDLPVRVFHWLLVASVAGAWFSRGSESLRDLHLMFGYTVAFLLMFRVYWGFAGSYHARFESYDCRPLSVLGDLWSHFFGTILRTAGHTPAAAAAVVLLLVLAATTVACGILVVGTKVEGEMLGQVHAVVANALVAFAGLHVASVFWVSLRRRENIVRSMFSGRKIGRHRERIGRARTRTALALLVLVLGYWGLDRLFAMSDAYSPLSSMPSVDAPAAGGGE